VLDGDNIRHGLNKNWGFRRPTGENIRRIGEVAKLFADAEFDAHELHQPVPQDRDQVRKIHADAGWRSSRCS